MPIYTGRSTDGSDMEEVSGAYINPYNPNEWSTNPYIFRNIFIPEGPKESKSQRDYKAKVRAIRKYMNGKYCLRDVYEQIKAKTCTLSAAQRAYVLSHFDKEGNFIN